MGTNFLLQVLNKNGGQQIRSHDGIIPILYGQVF